VKLRSLFFSFAVCAFACTGAHAASVYVTPSHSVVPSPGETTVLHLFMDFSDDPTLGGGLDIDLTGPISLQAFTPSAWFDGLDPFFTGYSTEVGVADHELALWFGDFNGLGGVNEIGTLSVNLLGNGSAAVNLGINSLYGPFFSATDFDQQDVQLTGATLDVGVPQVPLPAAAWLLASGVGAFFGMRRTRLASV
jgi:hypothetical protein